MLIETTAKYIISCKKDLSSSHSYFPSRVGSLDPSRLGWCYGDLGICCALWQSLPIINDSSLPEFISEVLRHAATRREFDKTRILDDGFCHGSSGVAHIVQPYF